MRINNVSTETSSQLVVTMSIIASVVTIAFVFGYITTSVSEISFFGFFQWLFYTFQALMADCQGTDDAFIPWLVLGLIAGVYIGFIGAFISRHKAIAKFKGGLNIKYINLLEGRVEFFFTKPQYNFICAYSDIEKLYMDLQSTLVRTKNGSYIAFQQMNLKFTALNGKIFELSNTTSSPMKLIYKVIDWTRGVQSFDYGFSGYGEIPDYKEKIDAYLQSGYKDIVGKEGANKLKWMSIIFFIMGSFFIFVFKDMFNDVIVKDPFAAFIFLPFSIFFIISFIIDIVLVVDNIRDRKYRGHNGQI